VLELVGTGKRFYPKSHKVTTLIFTDIVTINDVNYGLASLSMELGSGNKVAAIVG
jgi:hypothetical protein